MPRRPLPSMRLALLWGSCALLSALPIQAARGETPPARAAAADSTAEHHVTAPRGTAELSRPAPTPSHGRTELKFTVTKPGIVDLAIYDITGKLVKTLVHGVHAAGSGVAVWDGRDTTGAHVPNGLYFARLAAPGAMPRVQKIALVR